METGGDNKNIGDLNLHQTSQSTEQGNGITNNTHKEAQLSSQSSSSSQNSSIMPGDETKNTGNSSDEPTKSDNKIPCDTMESSQNQPSASETVPTNVESHTPPKCDEDCVQINSVPKHEHGDVADGVNQGLEIQTPPIQVMERPGESDTSPDYTFPSHVFSKSNGNSQVGWSTASNESLFSIHMGNTSFSNELGCFKSREFDRPDDVCVQDQPNASPTHYLATPTNKFNAMSQRTHELLHAHSSKTAEAKAAERMREVIMESSATENLGKGHSRRHSNGSSNSYAFQPSSKSPDRSVSSLSAGAKEKEKESSNTAGEALKSTTKEPSNWLGCFPCFDKGITEAILLLTLILLSLFLSLLQNLPPMAAKSITPDAVSTLLANPSPDSSSDLPDIVVQVVDLKPSGNRYMFSASDGKKKLRAILPSNMYSEVLSGNIQNLGLVRILDYTLNDIPNKSEKYLIVTKCEPVSPALEKEIKSDEPVILLKPKEEVGVKSEGAAGILLKQKQEVVTKSAAQILNEQHRNSAPAARLAMTRRVRPLVSLNPYQGNWTIKVSVTSKGNMRTYKNARGEGCVFNVELTDEEGTQIQATMFNDSARKFYDRFVLGKVYYISKGTLKVANKQFKTVQNDYEMTLNENSEVEEVADEASFVPETKFTFVQIDQLGPYVNKSELVDVIGVVKNVSSTMSIRRKSDNESIPKRDITIADETRKTVVVSLWNDLATNTGQELLDIVDKSPVVAIKSLRVGDFQGVSLSTISRSVVLVNPDVPEAKKLRSWYEFEGKDAAMDALGSGSSPTSNNGIRSVYTDRVPLSHITSNQSLGDTKPAFFSLKGYISFIKPDQAMWYRACKTCNKKVTESIGSGYWCEGCQKSDEQCSLRYIMVARVCDTSGEAFISVFNEEAEKIVGCSADDLDDLKSQEGEDNPYNLKLKQATWVPHLFRVSVSQNEYNNEKRQRITARAVVPVDFAAESRIMLEEISKMRA
ncbi:hypothetical protein VNO80_21879 [Phaseolus coccineus]|uniref:Replication protein A subunit n=1 Tax=Phaseolus coccineus TaxID=3886 RepID=A0AAN9M6Y6_PHACN